MSERFFQSDVRASGQIYEYNTPLRQIYALSGAYITSSGNWEISGTSAALAATLSALYQASGLYEVSGTSYTKSESDARFQASGLYEVSGTGYTKAESDSRYQLSGFPAEGSGLYQAGTYYHVGEGWGITVTDSGVMAKQSDLDVRYTLSGSVTSTGDIRVLFYGGF